MTEISSYLLQHSDPVSLEGFSFELFPPKDKTAQTQFWNTINYLQPLAPDFISITYGADGSAQDCSYQTVSALIEDGVRPIAAHITSVGSTKSEVDQIAHNFWEAGIRHLIALRGDPPQGMTGHYKPHPQGYAYAADLVAGLKRVADFDISVAAYPETHPEAVSSQADLDNLKRKFDAGANRAISQFFFDPDCFLRFRDRVHAAGINAPIIPGILPLNNFARIRKFAKASKVSIPSWITSLFEGLDNQAETRQLVAAAIAAEQCRTLQTHGVRRFHFYTLNRAPLCFALCRVLGIRPQNSKAAA